MWVCTRPIRGYETVATTRTVPKKRRSCTGTCPWAQDQRAHRGFTLRQVLVPMCQPPQPAPARAQPLPSPGAKTPPKRRQPPQPPQHVDAAHEPAPLCLLVKLAGVAQVDRHRHPPRCRGQLRSGFCFRLRLRTKHSPPEGSASVIERRQAKKKEEKANGATKTRPHGLPTIRQSRDRHWRRPPTNSAPPRDAQTGSRSQGKRKQKEPNWSYRNARLKGKGMQRVPWPAQLPRPPRAPPRGRA